MKVDRSRVTALDLILDATIRICLAEHFSDMPVLSEETGLLNPIGDRGSTLAIVDPVDGTDSLIEGKGTWWVSVGVLQAGVPVAGLIYQPVSKRLHTASRPHVDASPGFIVGLSPDQLTADESATIRTRLLAHGANLVSTPHAAEKVAAVVEGRAAATVYLPSTKSPSWHVWDVAGGISIAEANGLVLRTLSGRELRLDPAQAEQRDPWMCASDEATWDAVRQIVDDRDMLR
ncbi:hypothetical protein A5719_10700 [Mycolicibacterium peregrinum]|nr:hypothetical protein A5719_10700 [Mycolicibacterium peregrinum]